MFNRLSRLTAIGATLMLAVLACNAAGGGVSNSAPVAELPSASEDEAASAPNTTSNSEPNSSSLGDELDSPATGPSNNDEPDPGDTPRPTAIDSPTATPSSTPTRTPSPTPTATPTIEVITGVSAGQQPDELVVRGSAPPDLNRGIASIGTGAGGCPYNGEFGMVNGDTWTYEAKTVGYLRGLVTHDNAFFCVQTSIPSTTASVVLPNGSTTPVQELTYGNLPYKELLPDIWIQNSPGTYHMRFTIYVTSQVTLIVPAYSGPYMAVGLKDQFVAGGFQPGEKIAGVAIDLTDYQGDYKGGSASIYSLEYDIVSFTANSSGGLPKKPIPKVNGETPEMFYLIGETGNIAGFGESVLDSNGDVMSGEQFLDLLYDAYWVDVIQCPGFLPSRLTAGSTGSVTPGEANNMRAGPGSGYPIVGTIPGNAQFSVLDGPACAEGTAWWLVNYNGQMGWTVEGDDNEYWLKP